MSRERCSYYPINLLKGSFKVAWSQFIYVALVFDSSHN
jgi:hypothetical protein